MSSKVNHRVLEMRNAIKMSLNGGDDQTLFDHINANGGFTNKNFKVVVRQLHFVARLKKFKAFETNALLSRVIAESEKKEDDNKS